MGLSKITMEKLEPSEKWRVYEGFGVCPCRELRLRLDDKGLAFGRSTNLGGVL